MVGNILKRSSSVEMLTVYGGKMSKAHFELKFPVQNVRK